MAINGTPSAGNDALTSDPANDEIIGLEGNDTIQGGGGADIIYGDVVYTQNGGLDSGQADNGFSFGPIDGWFNTGSGGTLERWGDGFLGLSTADDSAFMELDVHRNGIDHVQTNAELDTGVEYTLTFDAAGRAGGSANDSFEVTHNGIVVATVTPDSTTEFTTYSVTLTGFSGTDTIGFRELASQNNGLGPLLNNAQFNLTQAAVDAGTFTYDDVLDGGAGDDRVFGQLGNDTLSGGTGDDYLEGGIGNDIFAFADGSGSDVIGDFTIGEDILDLSNLTNADGNPVSINDVVVTSDGQGGSILIFPNGEQIRLSNIDPSRLDTDQELKDIGVPCLVLGALIQTAQGEVAIEDLIEGNEITTLCPVGGPQQTRKLRRIFRRQVPTTDPRFRPIRIMAGALGNGLPKRDLLVSRQHRMLVQSKIAERMFGTSDVLIAAVKLTALPGIFVEEGLKTVEYFHLLFDQHEVIYAEGAPTESLFTGPEALKAISPQAREELLSIFPAISEVDYAPVPARYIPEGKRQKKLIARHAKNRKFLL